MNKNYLVIHTPGAFGNFISYLVDCHKAGHMLASPFNEAGSSHQRHGEDRTRSIDVVVPGKWQEIESTTDKILIGCVWDESHFRYILHAYYGRTNSGQFGHCGVEYLQKDFFGFVNKHNSSERLQQDLKDIKKLFNLTVDEIHNKVPRHILRMFFWHKMIEDHSNIVTDDNERIKSVPGIDLINISQILDYAQLKSFFESRFDARLDFKQIHDEFIERNRSLNEFNRTNMIMDAVKNKESIDISNLTVMGEAMLTFMLEKHFFDIPFYNHIDFFKDTGEIIDYVKHFPNLLRQPNRLFHMHYKKFPPPKDNNDF